MTAMQELIKELEGVSKIGENPFIKTTVDLIIDMAEDKLQKEKDNLKKSFDFSEKEMHNSFSNDYYKRKTFDGFYQETFNDKVE